MTARWYRFPILVLMLGTAQTFAEGLSFERMAETGGGLSTPHDLALSPDGEWLYVADTGNHRVVVLDAVNLQRRGTLGESELSEPHDLAFDADGRLLVPDTGNSRIAVFQLDDDGARLVGELRQGISRPEGVAVDGDGRVFATGSVTGNLVLYLDGRVVAETGGFSAPHDVVQDSGGNAWVADAGHDRLVRLQPDLQPAAELVSTDYGFKGPRYMAFDAAGRLFVADKYNDNIKIIATDGRLLRVLDDGFDRPEGVAIRGQGLWLSDTYNHRIVRYRISGGR